MTAIHELFQQAQLADAAEIVLGLNQTQDVAVTEVGDDGYDAIFDGGGNDQIYGGDDNGRLYGETGDDQLSGGDLIEKITKVAMFSTQLRNDRFRKQIDAMLNRSVGYARRGRSAMVKEERGINEDGCCLSPSPLLMKSSR